MSRIENAISHCIPPSCLFIKFLKFFLINFSWIAMSKGESANRSMEHQP